MRVNVLHHATCFDGAASSAVFAAFFRRHCHERAQMVFIPKHHRGGNPYQPSDFAADEVAILDFRYTRADALVWFFDHHVSAFQLDGERDHFERTKNRRRHYDPDAPSCTGFLAKTVIREFGFDATPHEELLHWANIIDAAAFPNPQLPVEVAEPALQLMTFVENNTDFQASSQFIEDLQRHPLATIVQADYVRKVIDPALDQHRINIELIRSRARQRSGVLVYELLDQPGRAYNKFIPYFLHPKIRYVVGITRDIVGRIKLTAGYNPWLPKADREHHIALLCERFAGGGHPFVGGVSFDHDDVESARAALDWIAARLRNEAP